MKLFSPQSSCLALPLQEVPEYGGCDCLLLIMIGRLGSKWWFSLYICICDDILLLELPCSPVQLHQQNKGFMLYLFILFCEGETFQEAEEVGWKMKNRSWMKNAVFIYILTQNRENNIFLSMKELFKMSKLKTSRPPYYSRVKKRQDKNRTGSVHLNGKVKLYSFKLKAYFCSVLVNQCLFLPPQINCYSLKLHWNWLLKCFNKYEPAFIFHF